MSLCSLCPPAPAPDPTLMGAGRWGLSRPGGEGAPALGEPMTGTEHSPGWPGAGKPEGCQHGSGARAGLASEDPSCTGRGTRPQGEHRFKPRGGDEGRADCVINPTAHKMDGHMAR